MEDHVILVDQTDNEMGIAEKMAAHRTGQLHRAISIFVFDSAGRLLLQKRASAKYHSGGLWSNTCCSHPRRNERSADAARRRLQEEMGIDCEVLKVFDFIYRAEFSNGLIEHEYDHVFFGHYDGDPRPNPKEAEDWKWADLTELSADVKKHLGSYSFWLAKCLDRVIAHKGLERPGVCREMQSAGSLR
ncbi:MAG: isopentenyl-diphosphate Delta-isomerase [Xanthobacteraceae bacterium]|nr:MAG: isopentenyl-diphosphate Delta-isomerase [Xanthobacteraceae bacterium]